MPLTHAIAAFLKGVTLVEGHERWFELSDGCSAAVAVCRGMRPG
jgi:hypothetical protein